MKNQLKIVAVLAAIILAGSAYIAQANDAAPADATATEAAAPAEEAAAPATDAAAPAEEAAAPAADAAAPAEETTPAE